MIKEFSYLTKADFNDFPYKIGKDGTIKTTVFNVEKIKEAREALNSLRNGKVLVKPVFHSFIHSFVPSFIHSFIDFVFKKFVNY